MKKTLFLMILGCILYFSADHLYPRVLKKVFNVSGIITIKQKYAKKPNTMLFVILKNKGNVPVAVKKIISPTFPLNFNLNINNLIMPDLLSNRLYIEARLNNHGILGQIKPADMFGKVEKPIFINSKKIKILLK